MRELWRNLWREIWRDLRILGVGAVRGWIIPPLFYAFWRIRAPRKSKGPSRSDLHDR